MTFYCFGIIIVISIPIKERSFLSTTFLFFQYKQHNSKCFLAVKRWVHHSKVIMKFKNIITNISFCIFVGFECLVKSICRPDLTILKHLRAFVFFFFCHWKRIVLLIITNIFFEQAAINFLDHCCKVHVTVLLIEYHFKRL